MMKMLNLRYYGYYNMLNCDRTISVLALGTLCNMLKIRFEHLYVVFSCLINIITCKYLLLCNLHFIQKWFTAWVPVDTQTSSCKPGSSLWLRCNDSNGIIGHSSNYCFSHLFALYHTRTFCMFWTL